MNTRDMVIPNGECQYAITKYRNGGDQRVRTVHARITPKLVSTEVHRFDRQSGRSREAFNPYSKRAVLLAYRFYDGEWQQVAAAPPRGERMSRATVKLPCPICGRQFEATYIYDPGVRTFSNGDPGYPSTEDFDFDHECFTSEAEQEKVFDAIREAVDALPTDEPSDGEAWSGGFADNH